MRLHVEPGRWAQGVNRIRADHWVARRLAKQFEVDVMYYPKGWMPLLPLRGCRQVVTIHDLINFSLRKANHSLAKRAKAFYFSWMSRHALRRADRIITISECTRGALLSVVPERDKDIDVVYQGPGLHVDAPSAVPLAEREGFLVIGSQVPHKATHETIARLADYVVSREGRERRVTVAGLSAWPDAWGAPPQAIELSFAGRLGDDRLVAAYKKSRALLFLSEEEGFGLPLIESYLAGTPVCYRNASSMAEVMRGIPGGWDGESQNGFNAALDATLAMDGDEVAAVRKQFAEKYQWGRAACEILRVLT
jgi:glycosyltransferase involved in cell wall biosynthesis